MPKALRRHTPARLLLLASWFAAVPAAGLTALQSRARAGDDRGDIPGWVMIAIMSAAVVAVLIPLVGSTITSAFSNAIDSVTNANPNG